MPALRARFNGIDWVLAAIAASGAVLCIAQTAAVRAAEPVAATRSPAPGQGSDSPSNQSRDPQIEALIARMTIEEKAGQLSVFSDEIRAMEPGVNPDVNRRQAGELLREIRAGRVGALMNGTGVAGGRLMQKVAFEESRLKIPLLLAGDVIHGFRTVFPIPLGEAASFDPELAQRTARVAAVEATAAGLHWTFAPMVDVARDQRWGRVAEGAGEDVYLGRLFAAARVRGFQGQDLRLPDSMLATPKHFAAYGAVAGGMDYNTVDISEQTLREIHLPPFKAAFDAGALSTMSAFNEINGVPSSANRWLTTQLLRGEWGFKGLVVSDYTADMELIPHGYAQDKADAARLALVAGVDMSMQSGLYLAHLSKLVAQGRVPRAVVDESVRRVLGLKKALGLFADPYRSLDAAREKSDISTPEHRALAREAARKSIVLLKNSGDLLPLSKSAKIALIGPLGPDSKELHGPWTLFANDSESITLAAGLKRAAGSPGSISVVKGSEIEKRINGGVAAAVAAARAADVVVLAIGESARMSGEAQSRTEITIPAVQQEVAEAVAATGKPIVVLIRNGRALALQGAVRNARAIVVTWFLGSETGNAVADVLYGDYSPSGRLPVSFPQESGQEPYFYNHKNTGRPYQRGDPEFKARYRETTNEALYPFGHGLSYSKLSYGPVTASSDTIPWNGSITVRARIVNTGKRTVVETAQLYIHDRVASMTRPVRELKGIARATVAAGRSAEVSFTLSRKDLEFVGRDLQWTAEPGAFDIWIAPSSTQGVVKVVQLAAP